MLRWNMKSFDTLLMKAFVALHAHVPCDFVTAFQFATGLFLQIVAVTVIAYFG